MFHFIILFLKKSICIKFEKMNMKLLLFLIFIILFCSCSSDEIYRKDLNQIFDSTGYAGCFIIYDKTNGKTTYINRERCNQRFSPASTFKIPNALIALETGAVTSDTDTIRYNGIEKPIPEWNQDHDLRSAFKYSVVWYYQDIANRIGQERMKQWLDSLHDYGTMVRAGAIDKFWLDGSLKISALEQIKFLTKLYNNELPFSQRTVGIVKDMMVYNKDSDHIISGKTGASESDRVGWFVGWVEVKNNAHIFALNITPKDSLDSDFMKSRVALTYRLLRELKVIN